MIFCGSLLSADSMSVPCTPTKSSDVKRVEINNGWFHDLRMSNDTTFKLTSDVIQKWDWDTIFHAKYENETQAGNVFWNLSEVSHLLVKRKKEGDFKWTTIQVEELSDSGNYNIEGVDITAQPGYTYLYAVVPIINNYEGEYCVSSIDVKSKCILVADSTEVWYTFLTDNFFNNTSSTPNSIVETMYDRYPTIVRNSEANYETVTVNAEFLPDVCNLDDESDGERIKYRKNVKLFLRNGRPKILKSIDGYIWFGYVTTPPTDNADSNWYNRTITWSLTETSDPNNESDLFDAGIINVPSQYWSYCDNVPVIKPLSE